MCCFWDGPSIYTFLWFYKFYNLFSNDIQVLFFLFFFPCFPCDIVFVQFNSQGSSISAQAGLGLGVQAPGMNSVTSASLQQQPNSIHQQSSQQTLMSGGQKDAGIFFLAFHHLLYSSSSLCLKLQIDYVLSFWIHCLLDLGILETPVHLFNWVMLLS